MGKSEKEELDRQIKNLTEKVERCRSEFNVKIKEMTSKCEELELKHKEEVTELSQQHSLEMEVELIPVHVTIALSM
jgi:chromosome segregation ATPase